MGMGFLSSIERVEAAENEDADPVGGAQDPVARFTEAAVDVGLIRPGDKLDRNVVELCLRVVEIAAIIGDGYPAAGCPEDTVGTTSGLSSRSRKALAIPGPRGRCHAATRPRAGLTAVNRRMAPHDRSTRRCSSDEPGAATAAPGDDFTAADTLFDLPFADPAHYLIRSEAADLRGFLGGRRGDGCDGSRCGRTDREPLERPTGSDGFAQPRRPRRARPLVSRGRGLRRSNRPVCFA